MTWKDDILIVGVILVMIAGWAKVGSDHRAIQHDINQLRGEIEKL